MEIQASKTFRIALNAIFDIFQYLIKKYLLLCIKKKGKPRNYGFLEITFKTFPIVF